MPRMLLTLLAVPLVACGYTIEYAGQVEDERGVARSGLQVSLSDVGYAEGRFTDYDVIARAENKETATTDAQGRFALQHDYAQGLGFGCGIDFQPVVVISESGPRGSVAVVPVKDDDSVRSVDVGRVRMLGAVDASADASGVYVALAEAEGIERHVQIDGQRWFVGPAGVLPLAALAACPSAAPCEHPIAAVGELERAHLRSPLGSLTARGSAPAALLASTDHPLVDGVRLPSAIDAAVVYLDLLDGAPVLPRELDALGPQLAVATDAAGQRFAPLPAGACSAYGSGLVCTAPSVAITGLRVSNPGARFQVRVFARAQ